MEEEKERERERGMGEDGRIENGCGDCGDCVVFCGVFCFCFRE